MSMMTEEMFKESIAEIQLKAYQKYIKMRIKKLLAHLDNLDTEDNTITCSCMNTILEDIKQTVSCIEHKHSKIS